MALRDCRRWGSNEPPRPERIRGAGPESVAMGVAMDCNMQHATPSGAALFMGSLFCMGLWCVPGDTLGVIRHEVHLSPLSA